MTQPERLDSFELPAPTVWPMVVALGVTLGFTGLVTHVAVSVVGVVLALVGLVGWWRNVLPEERVEHVPVSPAQSGPSWMTATPRSVERLAFGEERHRVRVPIEVQPLSAGVRGGLVGACAMAVCAAIYGIVIQGSLWYPLNLLAAIAMPRMAEADVTTLRAFDGVALVVGLVAHGLTSVLVGALYAAILPLLPRRHLLWGGLLAPLLWTGLLWATLGVIAFGPLYARNCAGCHGRDGRLGAARALNDPVYLALVPAERVRQVIAVGVPGTAQPAFALDAGGSLTDQQIDVLVRGIEDRWVRLDVIAGQEIPPYGAARATSRDAANAERGREIFAGACARCHGDNGRGGPRGGSVTDPSYLALVSDQHVRTTVIAGRSDLGMPDWRGDGGTTPLTPQQVSDVVAWLVAQRRPVPGRLQ